MESEENDLSKTCHDCGEPCTSYNKCCGDYRCESCHNNHENEDDWEPDPSDDDDVELTSGLTSLRDLYKPSTKESE